MDWSRKKECGLSITKPDLVPFQKRGMAIHTQHIEPVHIGSALHVASDIVQRYQLTSLQTLMRSCQTLAENHELSVAVIGRFKAGKSSFLNHYLERDILPVGVVPVTTVITEIGYGKEEKATVHFLDDKMEILLLNQVSSFIAEHENPGNRKGVASVAIELPQLLQSGALRFVDMPGLDSTFAHNTETARDWLPKVGLALVAVSVDCPLSEHDITLIRSLYEYTPRISILLTKVDLLNDAELREVLVFISEQLKEAFPSPPEIYPYSIRRRYEHLRAEFNKKLLNPLLAEFQDHRSAVLHRKVDTILRECHDYLTLALRSAETIESQREIMRQEVLGSEQVLHELKSELELIVHHSAANLRTTIDKRLDEHRFELENRLLSAMRSAFPHWTKSLAYALTSYESWLNSVLAEQLAAISAAERKHLLRPLDQVKAQIFRRLQNFRDRLSEQAMLAFGVPLRTTEQDIHPQEPHTPDVRIGHIFDRNWELLSPILPMSIVEPLVRHHFTARLPSMIEKNLSRLTTQWDEGIRGAMVKLETEAKRRIDELVSIADNLLSTARDHAPRIREDLERLNAARQLMPLSDDAK